jgi:hypothetical protein
MHIKQFLDEHSDKRTTANRCKRLFSTPATTVATKRQATYWGMTA